MTASAYASPRPTSRLTGRRRRRARISLTPLIDVVFILLVFFMLATSFPAARALQVQAPAAALGGTSLEGALLVVLRPDGLRFAGERITAAQLDQRLAEYAARNPRQRVLVAPRPGVSLQEAVILFDRVAAAGLRDVAFAPSGGR